MPPPPGDDRNGNASLDLTWADQPYGGAPNVDSDGGAPNVDSDATFFTAATARIPPSSDQWVPEKQEQGGALASEDEGNSLHHSRWTSWGGFANTEYERAYFDHCAVVTESNVGLMRLVAFMMQAAFTFKRMYLEYHDVIEPARLWSGIAWNLGACFILLLIQRRFPHVKRGVLGFVYPYDVLFWTACLIAVWPSVGVYIATDSLKNTMTIPLSMMMVQLAYQPSMKITANYVFFTNLFFLVKLMMTWEHVHDNAKANVVSYTMVSVVLQICYVFAAYCLDNMNRNCFQSLLSDTKKRNQLLFAVNNAKTRIAPPSTMRKKTKRAGGKDD